MPTPVTDPDLLAQLNAPDRAPVAGSQKVWGDKEAEAAGLYEPRSRPVTDPALLAQLNGVETAPSGRPRITISPFNERFASEPQQAPALQGGLERRAMEMQRGPANPPMTQMATDFQNVLSGASQGSVPHVDRYGGRLVSTEAFEGDDGNVYFRDPSSGQVVPTDQARHVALRDPADGRVKVFDRSEATNESGAVGAARVMMQGAASGAPTARPAIATASKTDMIPRASDIQATAKPYYRAFEAESARAPAINADMAKVMVDRVHGALDTAHLPAEVAKQVHDTVALIGKRGETTLQGLQYAKRAVGNLFKSPDPNVRNGAAVASKEISRMIAEISPEAAKNLSKADQIHSAAKSVQQLQRTQQVAGIRTGAAGYGGNAVNHMRQVLKPIVIRAIEGKTTGFKADEIAAMQEIVEGSTGTNIARGIGQFSPTKGSLASLGGMVTGGGAGVVAAGPVGLAAVAALPAIGAVANKVAAIMTRAQIARLNEIVAKRSPEYAKAVAKAMERYNKAQSEFASQPTPNRFAAYVSASRALSSGLSKDGITIASGDLLRAIQGPMKSAADNENPEPEGVINR